MLNEYQKKVIELGLKEDQLYSHDWSNESIAIETINFLENRPDNMPILQAMDNIRGLDNHYKIRAIGLGLRRGQLHYQNWDNYEIAEATIDHLKNRPDDMSALQAIQNINGVNSKYEIEAISLGLKKEELAGHDWYNGFSFYDNLGDATINYLKNRPDDMPISEAMDNVRGLRNIYQIEAVSLGLKKEELEGHDWYGYGHGISLTENLGDATINYLKNRPKNLTIQQAFNKIKGIDKGYKIYAIELGLTRDQLDGCDWSYHKAEAIIDYLKNHSQNITIFEAFNKVKDIDNFYKINAMALGLEEKDLEDHNWDSFYIGHKTIEYLKNRPKNISIQQAMENIRGLDNEYKIQAIGLGLTKEELAGHDWGLIGDKTIEYLEKNFQNISISQAMENIRGLENKYQIQAISLGLKKEELAGHDWQIIYLDSFGGTFQDTEKLEATIFYLKNHPQEITISQAMDNVRGLDKEYKIQAIGLGLTKEQIEDHDWGNDSLFGDNIAMYHIDFVKNRPEGITALEALKSISGLDNRYKIEAVGLGLTKDQLYDHDWLFHGRATINYLKNRPENVSISQAMENIRGLDNEYKIKAISLGLTKDQLYDHDWKNHKIAIKTLDYLKNHPAQISTIQAMNNIRGITSRDLRNTYFMAAIEEIGLAKNELQGHDWLLQGRATINYLKNRPENVSISQAMENIRGLDNEYKIKAIRLGLTKDQLMNHDWNNNLIAAKTIEYLKNHPIDIPVSKAMNNIRGFNENQLKDILKAHKEGKNVFGLSDNQLYITTFTSSHIKKMKKGKSYEDIIPPEANIALKEIEENKTEFTKGSVIGLLSAARFSNFNNNDLLEFSELIAKNLSIKEGKLLSTTCESASKNAKSSVIKLREIRALNQKQSAAEKQL